MRTALALLALLVGSALATNHTEALHTKPRGDVVFFDDFQDGLPGLREVRTSPPAQAHNSLAPRLRVGASVEEPGPVERFRSIAKLGSKDARERAL